MFDIHFKPYNNNDELNELQKIRLNFYKLIFNQETKLSKCYSVFITIIILIAITSSCLETLKAYKNFMIWNIIEFACCLIFIIEYMTKIIVITNKYKYMRTFCHFIDLVSIIPIFFAFQKKNDTSNIISFFKVLKLIRIIKVLSINKLFNIYCKLIIKTMLKSVHGLKLMIVFIVIVMIFASSLLYEIEKGIRNDGTEPYTSIPATFYWSIVTMTTVGYGDIYPITDLGRFFASLTMIMGILIIALPITIISSNFSQTWNEFENRGLIKVKNNNLKIPEKFSSDNIKLLIINYCINITNLNQLTEIEKTLIQLLQKQITDNIDLISKIKFTYISNESEIETIINNDEEIV